MPVDISALAEGEVPESFNCPITTSLMRDPVVCADGHSYELKAMQKWLLKKQTSPVTGKPLVSTNLSLNQNLKKLIHDFTSAPKRKAPADEDLDEDAAGEWQGILGGSDDDDDDGPAHRHATFGPAMSDLIPPIDEGASSATAVPPPKRMKVPPRRK